MDFLASFSDPSFWGGLLAIVWLNIILSGDNAVVIALAVRTLSPDQQQRAVIFGAGAAVVMRIILTLFAATLLQLPYLKILGGLLLLWIAVKLLIPSDPVRKIAGAHNLWQAIRTILLADLVMSVDNVLAVAATADGDLFLLICGLLISIPLVVWGATVLMNLMERFPAIILFGAAMIGWVAGEMIGTDPVAGEWLAGHLPWMRQLPDAPPGGAGVLQILGAVSVVVCGKVLFRKNFHVG